MNLNMEELSGESLYGVYENQSNTILEELRKSEAMMVHKRSQLIEMCQELMVLSQKSYEGCFGR